MTGLLRSLVLGFRPGQESDVPGEFNSAFHAVASGNRYYASDLWNHRIQVFEGNGSFVRAIGGKGMGEGQLMFPMGLAVRGEELFVVEGLNHRIQVFGLDGKFVRTFGQQGSGAGQVCYPTALAISDDEVFVSDSAHDRVVVFDTAGRPLREFGGVRDPMEIAFHGGEVLVVEEGIGVKVFSRGGAFVRHMTGSKFKGIAGIAMEGNHLYASIATGYVRLFSPVGEFLAETKLEGAGVLSLVSANEGSVLVADYGSHCVFVLANSTSMSEQAMAVPSVEDQFAPSVLSQNEMIKTNTMRESFRFGEGGSGPGKIRYPYQALEHHGEILVSDQFNNRISVFGLSGGFLRLYGGKGSAPGRFMYPMGLAVQGDEVFVADGAGRRIQVFGTDGTFRRMFGQQGSGMGTIQDPLGIAVVDNEVFVVDYGNECIKVYDVEGTFLRQWGELGIGPGQFLNPIGICLHGGLVFVTDKDRVQTFTKDGKLVRELKGSQVAGVGGIAASNDHLYVSILTTGANGCVRMFSMEGECAGELQPNGSMGLGLLSIRDDRLLVPDEKRHCVYQLKVVNDGMASRL